MNRGKIAVVSTTYPRREDIPLLGVCRTVSEVESSYVWDGARVNETEFRVEFKTPAKNARKLAKHVEATHPYEVPMVSVRFVRVNGPYEAWAKQAPALESTQ